MLVSTIIPTRGRPVAIFDAVSSIFNGNYQNFEVFVIDQSPDEETSEILKPFMADPRFFYLQNRRPGFGAASSRNMGIALSSGEIIAITDDDVEVRPDWLERIVAEFQADPDLDFISGRLTSPAYDTTKGFTPSFDADPSLPRQRMAIHVSGANFSMRRSLFDRVGGYDEFCGPGSRLRASDDTDLCHRILRSGAKVQLNPEIEVVHTHGFREIKDAEALHRRYAYGNGGNYGRFTRRGDLRAGAWFLLREGRNIVRTLVRGSGEQRKIELQYSHLRLRGFWHGFMLPVSEGFVGGAHLHQMGAELKGLLIMAERQVGASQISLTGGDQPDALSLAERQVGASQISFTDRPA